MGDLTASQRTALETFLTDYDEPDHDELTTFEILLADLRDGNTDYIRIANPFTTIPNEELAELINCLDDDIQKLTD